MHASTSDAAVELESLHVRHAVLIYCLNSVAMLAAAIYANGLAETATLSVHLTISNYVGSCIASLNLRDLLSMRIQTDPILVRATLVASRLVSAAHAMWPPCNESLGQKRWCLLVCIKSDSIHCFTQSEK